MPTNNYFTGASSADGNIATAGNWTEGHIPTSGEIAVFDRTAYDIYGNNSATACDGVQVTPGWRGKFFGTSATPVGLRTAGNCDIAVSANCELVHIGAGSNTIAKVRASGIRQFVVNGGTVTALEADQCGVIAVVANTTVTNARLSRCGNVLYDVLGTGTGASIIYILNGTNLTTKRAAANACATIIGAGCTLTVADPGSLGTQAGGSSCLVFGTLTYRSSVAGPNWECFPGGKVNEMGALRNITYGDVRDWIDSFFDDRPTGITVTPTSRVPVTKAT